MQLIVAITGAIQGKSQIFLDLKVIVAGGYVENVGLSINDCQLLFHNNT